MADMNIDDVVNDSLSSQGEAIQDLNVSEATGVDTSVVNNEPNSAKAADLTPKTVTEGVGRTISESRTIASAVSPEANKFSDAERLGRTIRLNIEGSDVSKRRSQIALEIMDFKQKNPDKPVPDDIDLEITYYRQENQRIAKELAETDPGLLSEGTAAMLSSFRDTAKSAVDHFGKVLSGTAAGARLGAIGGTVGLPIPLLGTFTGAIGGGITGAAVTTMAVSAYDNVQRMRGETYDELSTVIINNKPANISEETKRNISNAIGVLGGAVEYGLERFALSKIPGVRGLFNPAKVAKEVATNPALAKTLAQFGKGIAANMVGEGAVEGVQYNLDIIAEELGKSWDGSQTSLTKALTNVTNRPDYAKGLAKQVTVGAIAGGTGAAALGTPGVIHERVQAQIAQSRKFKSERARAIEQAQAMTEPGDNGVDQTLTPKEITPDAKRIIVDEGQAKFLNSQQSLTLALVLQNTSDAVKDSKLDGQLSTAVELQKKMLEQSGVNQVWVSAEDLNKWADSEKKREKVQKWFGVYDPDLDTRLPVDVGTLSEMIQEDEAFNKMVRPTVDDMSFNELLTYYKDRPERINRDFVAMGVAPAQAPAEIQAEGVGVPLETEQPVGKRKSFFSSTERARIAEQLKTASPEMMFTVAQNVVANPEKFSTDQLIASQEYIDAYNSQVPERIVSAQEKMDINNFRMRANQQPVTAQLGPSSTDEEILATIGTKQEANAYLGRLSDEEARLKPLYHGTSAKFEKLDPSISGGMVNFSEEPSVAELYANSAGGGRNNISSNDELYIEAHGTQKPGRLEYNKETDSYEGDWQGEFLSIPRQDAQDFVDNSGEAIVKTKSARIIESSYDPSKVLDITKSEENNNKLANILESLPENKIAQAILEQSKKSHWDSDTAKTTNLSRAWWGLSKMSSYERTGVSPTINKDFKEIVKALKDEGYESLRFNDDTGVTVALFEPSERLSQIQQMKERVTALSEQLPEAEPDLDGTKDVTLDDEVELAFQQFASRPVFTDLIRAGVSPSVVKVLESEYAAIRQEIIQATKDTAYEEMIATANIVDEIKKTEDAIEAIEDSLNDPNIEIVETFITNLDRLGAEAQVNPDTMTPEQRNRYLDDPVLKRRGVFNKYGKLTLNDLALQLGVQDGEVAMGILRSTPDLDQAFKNAKELTKLAIDTEVLDSVDYNNTAIIKALDKKQKLDAQTFKLLVESSWNKARRGIEGTVFANIDTEKIKQDTTRMIEAIPTGKLNPNVYLRASKRAAIKKVKAALRGDFLEAGRQREIEIRADEAYKQALVTKAKANRMVKKLGRWVRSRAIIQTLKDARLYDAFKDLSKIVNLDPNTQAKLGSFEKIVKKAIDDQTVDMSIPQELINELDSAATPSELSFDQLSFVYNKHAELIKHAKSDNMIQVEQEKLYVGEVAPMITEELADHPDKDASKLQRENQVTASAGKRLGAMLRSVALYLPTINFITMKLAQAKNNSFIRKFIYDQLKGIGAYDNGYGDKSTIKQRSRLRKAVTALQKLNNRRKRIQGYAQDIISPFQFAESTGLVDSRGEMTKLQLMTSMLFYGTHTGRQRLGNFNINPETFLEVAQEHLTQDDMDFIQSIWDLYESFKPAIKRMVQEIRGHEVEFVEGAAFEFKGKQYRGGYVPLRYRKKATLAQVTRESNEEMNVALGLEKEIPFDIEAAEAFTKQGNLISRVKNYDGQLNLDWNYVVTAGFEDIIMQTTMHVPILNIMRVLKNQEVGESMASVLGLDEYQELKNHIIGAGRSSISEQLELNSELANNFKFALSKPVTNFVKNTLIGVPSTVLMQLSSGVYAWHSQGIGATATYMFQVAKLLARPTLLPEAVKLAAELDPSIGTYVENVTEDTRGGIGNIVAKNLYTGSPVIGRLDAKLVNMLNTFDDITTKIFLDGILGNIDMMLKVPAVLTMYERFISGKVQGFESEVLAKMTPFEIEREARAYATRTSQGTLTATSNIEKAKAQKVKWLSGWSRYFNDIRNIYNYTMLNTVSKTRWNLTNARKDFANGDTLDGVMKISGAAYGLIAFQMYATVAATIISAARGRGTDEDEEEIILETMFTHEWEKQIVQTALNHFTNPFTVPKNVVSALPIVRDMVFSTEIRESTGDRVRPIVAPMDVSVINIVVDGYRALQVVWENDGDFTDKQLNTILKGLSPFAPIPYRAIDQYMKSDSFGDKAQEVMNDPAVVLMAPAVVVMIADALIERFKNNGNAAAMEQVQTIKDMLDPNNTTQVQAIAEGLELPITDYEKYVLMYAESSGNPNAKVKSTGAYGLYQFTEKTWNSLVEQYGDLYGLTIDGRKTSPEQQEIAFRLITRDEAKSLIRNGLEVNIDNLYAVHHFGRGVATRILKMPDNAELPNLDEQRSKNPWLNGDSPDVNDGKYVNTVGEFKRGLKDILEIGKRKYIKAMDLD